MQEVLRVERAELARSPGSVSGSWARLALSSSSSPSSPSPPSFLSLSFSLSLSLSLSLSACLQNPDTIFRGSPGHMKRPCIGVPAHSPSLSTARYVSE